MKQERVYTIPQLITSTGKAIGGASLHGPAIQLHHNTAGAIIVDRNAFLVARDHYEASREELAELRLQLDSEIVAARQFATIFRELLKLKLGKQYSQRWDITGFKGALRIPSKAVDLLPLLLAMETYLAANLAWNNDQLGINAAKAGELAADLLAAMNGVNAQVAEVKRLLQARDAAMEILRKRMRGLVAELTQLLSGLDPRWHSFGLNRPGATQRPEAPKNVELAPMPEKNTAVKWEDTPRAEYYRVRQRIVGVDEDFVLIGSPSDPDFTIEEAPRNATLELAISAVNKGGESSWTVVMVRTGDGELQIEK